MTQAASLTFFARHELRLAWRDWLSMMTAFGVKPCFATASSDARMVHEAPSVICDELPAVTWPQGRSNTGLSFANVSGVESGRTPSS